MMTKENQKLISHYSKLIGLTMVGTVEDGSPETIAVYGKSLIGLKFKHRLTGEVKIVFPMSDAEGNNTGFLEIINVE